ncbi:outer membrane beta-barrel family protein [Emticicia sp. 21SJ11W-3]|uniref:outer membrane beta-barrel family protein n=1 Tax=Emticicia sp. 21SJ11W-3 TaxID=2916755 RepID=UPI0020A00489|nr:outer membrane beta-barrel family protein [Emticicia sp. 21SJ11W-3]UTA66661.1 outer membrane beta-barrel family protein [Emticicia sp. 21SJ11W-3]
MRSPCLATLLCCVTFITSFGQGSRHVRVCVRATANTKNYTIRLIRVSGIAEKMVSQQTVYSYCTDIAVAAHGTYKLSVQSDCCAAITEAWLADTLKNNHQFNINLEEKSIQLKEVVVKEKKDRFERRGDTLFVNIADTDARPHAAAATLFDRINGLNSSFGSVSILGEDVQEITIDGKRIFGGISKLTLESIRADMIERMEFIQKTLANGQKQNLLNIKLKANKKDGIYGDIEAGPGENRNYIGRASVNKITKNGFINAFSTANSINETGIDTKVMDRISLNTFRNALNASSSVIGLYEPRTIENNTEKLEPRFRGINKYFDTGLNFTHEQKKLAFDGFIFGHFNRQTFWQASTQQQFYPNVSQTINSQMQDKSRIGNINANINLKWNINERTSLRVSSQLNHQNQSRSVADTTITGFSSVPASTLIISRGQKGINALNHISQLSLVQKGRRGGFVSSLYFRLDNQFQADSNHFDNSLQNPAARLHQNQIINKRQNNTTQTVQLVQSVPLSSQFLIEGKLKGLFENYSIRQHTSWPIEGNPPVPVANSINNQIIETGIYVLYKRAKIDIISGLAYSHWHIHRQTLKDCFTDRPSFLFNPFTKIEYRFPSGKLSARFAQEPLLPGAIALITPPDSSHLNQITVGNLFLNPYQQKTFELTTHLQTRNGHQFNLNFNYKRLNGAVINENFYQPDLNIFTSGFINAPAPVSNWNLNFSAYQIKLKSKFSWFFMGGMYQINSLTKTLEALSPLQLNLAYLNVNTTLKLKSTFNLKANWESQFRIIRNNAIINHLVNLKSEADICNKWFVDSGLRLNINQSGTTSTQLLADAVVGKFLLKNNALKVSLAARNIFNTKQQITIEQGNNYQSTMSANTLPRVILLKFTIYPESWKK